MKYTKAELTKVYARYARKHNFSVSTVRYCTALKMAAIMEWETK